VLEVGCGRAVGIRSRPEEVWGVDAEPEQVRRAGHPRVVAGDAAAIPFRDRAFDALVSVEAAQHFDDFAGFARECARVMKPEATLAVTTFFTPQHATEELAGLLPMLARGVERAHPIDEVRSHLDQAGLVDITAQSIGAHVWQGLDRWLEQGPHRDNWDRNYKIAADRGLLDYYLVTARQPAGSGV
jgi:MPBQ/MSBQ methyltransferase